MRSLSGTVPALKYGMDTWQNDSQPTCVHHASFVSPAVPPHMPRVAYNNKHNDKAKYTLLQRQLTRNDGAAESN